MSGIDINVDFKAFQNKVQSSLVNVTKTAGQISNEELGFHRTSSRKLSKAVDEQNARLLALANKLLKAATENSNVKPPKLTDAESIDDNWRTVVDVVDNMLEKADASLDEFSGVIKQFSPVPQDDAAANPPRSKERREPFNIFHNASMSKPQRLFNVKPNNYETKPFRPLLKTKPHATISLAESIGEAGPNGYSHPYASELEQYRYPRTVYQTRPPIPFHPPDAYQAVFVDTEDGVQEMLGELRKAKEIAVDLEHHDTHSYIGLVSLMQISTRDKDWIVDTLKPWRENLQCLNEVFADPTIVKVFHGSNMDIRWLQRDLGLYVVGLFDTFHAANALRFPAKSLKYLLEKFASFHAQKKYQMADWRVRPLPKELIEYARSDTHYLLYIYDELRNMLVEASTPIENLIDAVLEGSKKEALQVYERPIYDVEYGLGSGGWFKQVTQRSIQFDGPQLAVYKAVHYWRDQKAREWDEGEQSIMTLAQLYGLAETMPTTVPALYNSLRQVSKLVATNSKELVSLIGRAKAQGQNQPSLRDVVKSTEEKFGPCTVRGRRHQHPPTPPAEDTGLGSTLQMLTKSGTLTSVKSEPIAVVDDAELNAGRTLTSRLWGMSLPQIGGVLAKSSSIAAQALKNVLPIGDQPNLSLAANENTPVPMDPEQLGLITRVSTISLLPPAMTNGSDPIHTVEGNDQIFTLRDRKRKASLDDDPDKRPSTDGFNTSAEDHERIERKNCHRAGKRIQKVAAAAAKKADVLPFDYANAQSMLDTQPDADEQKGQANDLVNPYAKALNTSTGAKRTNQEKPGKSFTFKQ